MAAQMVESEEPVYVINDVHAAHSKKLHVWCQGLVRCQAPGLGSSWPEAYTSREDADARCQALRQEGKRVCVQIARASELRYGSIPYVAIWADDRRWLIHVKHVARFLELAPELLAECDPASENWRWLWHR